MDLLELPAKTDSYREVKTIQSRSQLEAKKQPHSQSQKKQAKSPKRDRSKQQLASVKLEKEYREFYKNKQVEKGLKTQPRSKKKEQKQRNLCKSSQNGRTLSPKFMSILQEKPEQKSNNKNLNKELKNILERLNNISSSYQKLLVYQNQTPNHVLNVQQKHNHYLNRPVQIQSVSKKFETKMHNSIKIHKQFIQYSSPNSAAIKTPQDQSAIRPPQVKYISTSKQIVKQIQKQNYLNQRMRTDLCQLRNRITKYKYQIGSSNNEIEMLERRLAEQFRKCKSSDNILIDDLDHETSFFCYGNGKQSEKVQNKFIVFKSNMYINGVKSNLQDNNIGKTIETFKTATQI